MKVAELRAVLDHLPGDLVVCVQSAGAEIRHPALASRSAIPAGEHDRRGALVLVAGDDDRSLWTRPEPRYELRGRFRDPDGLEAKLDPLGPLGDPEAR